LIYLAAIDIYSKHGSREAAVARTRYASNEGLRIAYELRWPACWWRPWLVLIQGMGFDRAGWGPVLRRLQRRFRLVLMDNRGTGQSGRRIGSFAVADMARDVVAVLDAAGIRRAHVLGVSLGGMVAQELAIAYPELVAGLVLACTTPGWPFGYPMPKASVRLIAATPSMTAEVALRRHTQNALSAWAIRRQPELLTRLIELQRHHPVGRETLSAQAAAGAWYAGSARQMRIQAPTLVLHGGADAIVDARNATLLAGNITGARLVLFAELGHLLFWEDSGAFADAVTSFLRSNGR